MLYEFDHADAASIKVWQSDSMGVGKCESNGLEGRESENDCLKAGTVENRDLSGKIESGDHGDLFSNLDLQHDPPVNCQGECTKTFPGETMWRKDASTHIWMGCFVCELVHSVPVSRTFGDSVVAPPTNDLACIWVHWHAIEEDELPSTHTSAPQCKTSHWTSCGQF